jgi:hypothetical protein
MPETSEQYFKQPAGIAALWSGVLAGPFAWALSQQVTYLLATLDCSHGMNFALSPVMIVTLLLAAGGGLLSWRNWRRAGQELLNADGGVISRSRFLAACGLALSCYSALVIVAEWVPIFFYRQCQR